MDSGQRVIPITKVKRELLEIVKEMGEEDSTVMVTRNEVPVGIMITPERYEALLETIEVLGSPEIMKALAASGRDFESGKVSSHEEVWAES